jgi:hypothetical protein
MTAPHHSFTSRTPLLENSLAFSAMMYLKILCLRGFEHCGCDAVPTALVCPPYALTALSGKLTFCSATKKKGMKHNACLDLNDLTMMQSWS